MFLFILKKAIIPGGHSGSGEGREKGSGSEGNNSGTPSQHQHSHPNIFKLCNSSQIQQPNNHFFSQDYDPQQINKQETKKQELEEERQFLSPLFKIQREDPSLPPQTLTHSPCICIKEMKLRTFILCVRDREKLFA